MIGRLGATLVLAAACAADAKLPQVPQAEVSMLRLSAEAPRAATALRRGTRAPTSLAFTLETLEDPAAQAYSVSAEVRWAGDGEPAVTAAIGQVTPFPATGAARFELAVPADAAALLSRVNGRLELELGLVEIDEDRPLRAPLRVEVRDVAWR
ncbi:MAG: hypothetical protein R3B48_18340 [Kofleriaceae bacterium]